MSKPPCIETDVVVVLGRSSGSNAREWLLELKCAKSRDLIARIPLKDAELGRILGAADTTVGGAQIFQSPNIGARLETVTPCIPIPDSLTHNRYNPERWAELVAGWAERAGYGPETGWTATIERGFNSHRLHGKQPQTALATYETTFRRWVREDSNFARCPSDD